MEVHEKVGETVTGTTILQAPPSESALTTAGQRRINVIWEMTQAIIAIVVVLANILVWIFIVFNKVTEEIPSGLTNALFLVVGFYFSRTNHQAIGGVGRQPNQTYEGR
jgi:hypothetical protein